MILIMIKHDRVFVLHNFHILLLFRMDGRGLISDLIYHQPMENPIDMLNFAPKYHSKEVE